MQIPDVPHHQSKILELDDRESYRKLVSHTSSQNDQHPDNNFKRPQTLNQNLLMRQFDDNSDYMNDPINKSMEHLPVDPDV